MQISIPVLRAVSEIIFSHIEAMEIGSVTIPADYYWEIPKDQRYDPYKEPDPKEFEIGQLSDDWSELQKIAEGKGEPIAYALVWMSSLLKAVGEEVVK